jgi:translation elongation factor EF-G
MSEETETLKSTLSKLHITLKPACYKMDVRPLLKVVLEAFFGPARALVDMITEKIPSPVEAAASLVCHLRCAECFSTHIPSSDLKDIHWSHDKRDGAVDAAMQL